MEPNIDEVMSEDLFILKSWDEQIIVFNNNLQTIRHRPAKKSVHDIRVAVKKIRSYLKLRQEFLGENWNEQFSNMKILFQTLGRQRDIEMSLSLLAKYQRKETVLLVHFKKFLQMNCRLTRKWSRQAAANFKDEQLQVLSSVMYESLTALSEEQVINKIREMTIAILKKVRKLSSNFKKNIHAIRKLLKDLYYWLKACPENPVSDLFQIKLLEKILGDLGSWQDYFIFLNKLKDFRKKLSVKGTNEFEMIKSCEEKTKKSQNELLYKIKIRGAVLFLK